MFKRVLSFILALMMLGASLGITSLAQEQPRGVSYQLPVDYIELDFRTYFNGICDGLDTATASKVVYDSKNCLKVIPNTNTENGYINLDGYSYSTANIDLEKFGTAVIIYKYVTERPLSGRAELRLMSSKIFSKATHMLSREELVANRWAAVSFDLTEARKTIIPGNSTVIKQLHYLPLGTVNATELLPEDELYVYKMSFFPEKSYGASYNNNYYALPASYDSDGNRIFKPSAPLTRAQACNMIARLVADSNSLIPQSDGVTGFSDISSHDYAKHIEYLEELGFLEKYSKTFSPHSAITQTEFTELAYLLGIYLEKGKAGLDALKLRDLEPAVPSRLSKPISHAEAVVLLNSVTGRRARDIFVQYTDYYKDINEGHYAYRDVLNASLGHISLIDENGDEYWVKGVGNVQSAFESFAPDYATGNAKRDEYLSLMEERISEIRSTPNTSFNVTGKTVYVSPYGDDSNSGIYDYAPLKTAAAANRIASSGDLVLFERGGEWRERWNAKSGVTYSAYGYGEKPIFNGNLYGDVAYPSLWTLVEGTTNVYKFAHKVKDIGNIVLNGGTSYATKVTPKLSGTDQLVNNKVFDPKTSLTSNRSFVCIYDTVSGSDTALDSVYSTLYFRCNNGNPGEYYDSIELCERGSLIFVPSNCHIDNLHIKNTGSHGFSMGSVSNVLFTNLEIHDIGGAAQYFNNGSVVRFGNGIEVYGACDGFTIDNCYVYQCYDAGITNQHSAGGANAVIQKNVRFINNVIDKCIYNIEYFLGAAAEGSVDRYMQDILYKGNILARSGGGWGYLPSRSASIVGWGHHRNEAYNFVIEENIFLADNYNCIFLAAEEEEWLPTFRNNIYLRRYNANFLNYGLKDETVQYKNTRRAVEILENILCEENPTVYYIQ